MFARAIILSTITASAVALPAAAQAPPPTTTAFDGTYAGESHNVHRYADGGSTRCATAAVQAPLTITNGVVRSPTGGNLEGTVNADGHKIMHRPNGNRVEGQIDAQGIIRAQYASPNCAYDYV